MRRVQLEYGSGHVEVDLPDGAVVIRTGEPHREPWPLEDPVEATRSALENPLGSDRIRDLVRPGSRVTIAFPDRVKGGTHATAHRRVAVPLLLDELERGGVRLSDVRLVNAIGLHRKNTMDEMAELLGEHVVRRMGPERIVNHDAEDAEGMVTLERSDHGDAVEVNRCVVDSDLTILVGHASGNPYGGFSGGSKMPSTGLTGWRSIRCHHTPASMTRRDFAPPTTGSYFRSQLAAIRQRMESAMPQPFFTVDAVLDSQSRQLRVRAGAIGAVEEASWGMASERTEVRLPGPPADVLVIGMPRGFHYGAGMGTNPILMMQAIGASVIRARAALRPDPVVIATSICDGWFNSREFPPYAAAYDLLQSCRHPHEMTAHEDNFCNQPQWISAYRHQHGYHPFHAFSMIYMGSVARDLAQAVYIAGAQSPEHATGMGATPIDSVGDALADATALVGRDPRLIVIPELSKPAYHLVTHEGTRSARNV
ncbi:lactate racemase domain-containing protein [Actinopolymorpha sp. B11F2]|uniref:lactate racemase domain-containing protein n=1 Tax=Actinopolymorpha sp. B11F2 TaxID=3160862 RepID=UPI0032E44275